ncbi:hemerythrin domain-containing protein [Sphingomonas sp. GB1N7]|uniref:hemerythrin domain-containing protein n=1 Tax=Parasphingomonas caseinilytica TaxID=3096158 RepID=UPI002FCB5F82
MDVARLLNEHSKLRSLSAALIEAVSTSEPGDLNELARRRWDLARMVHMHLAYEERHLFAPLETDPRSKVRLASMRAKRSVEQLHFLYKTHVEQWDVATVQSRWPAFQLAVKSLVGRMIDKMNLEETELFPLVANDVATERCWRPGMRNWAGDGVALQPLIRSLGKRDADALSATSAARPSKP